MKRLITTCFILLLLLSISAQTTFTVNNIGFNTTSISSVAVISNNYSGRISVPATVKYSGVTYNVTSFYEAAFSNSAVTSIILPSSVTSMIPRSGSDNPGLYKLYNLKKIVAPADYLNSVTSSTNNYSNYPSTLDTLIVTAGTLAHGALPDLSSYSNTFTDGAFTFINLSRGTLKYLDLKESANTELIDGFLENFYSLENLVLPKNLQKTHYGEYNGCTALKSIIIPASVTEIGERTFEDCRSLNKVVFEANSKLKTIDNWAFYACHDLDTISIPNGVTTIGDGAFWGCDYLVNLNLPSSVQSINDNSFEGCISLNKMSIQSAVPPIVYKNTFNKVNKSIKLVVPDASVSLYKNAFGWKDFYNIKGVSTELKNTEESNYLINVSNTNIEISNASGKSISIFDITGRKVFGTSNALGKAQFTVNNQGVYIIVIDNFKKKIIVN